MSHNCLRRGGAGTGRPVRRTLAVYATLLALTFTGCIAGRQAYGDTPAASEHRADARLTVPLTVDWKYTGAPFENNPASPVISGDTAYFGSGGRVYAVSLQTGAMKWRYPYEGYMLSPVQMTPVLSGDTLFVPTGDGLYALSTTDGKLKFPAFKLKGGVTTSPAVIGAGVYFGGANGHIYALNTQSGDPVSAAWKAGLNTGGDISGDVASDGTLLYFMTANSTLHAVDAATGAQRWGKFVDGAVGHVTPVIAGEALYLSTGQALVKFRASSGQLLWLLPTHSSITALPVADTDGNVYITTAERGVYALDTNRKLISGWKVPQVDYEIDAQPVISGNLLIVGTTSGGLYAFDRMTGELKWNYAVHPTSIDPENVPAANRVSNTPVIAGDTLFVLTDDGSLTAFRHDAVDMLPPSITRLQPEVGDYTNGRPPFTISAHIDDEGSGLDRNSITLKLDAQMIARRANLQEAAEKPGFIFDADNGILQYDIYESDTGKSNGLIDGHHTATITAKDWKGNMVTKTWSFFIDDTLPRKARSSSTNPAAGRPGLSGGKGGRGGRGQTSGGAGGDTGGKGGE